MRRIITTTPRATDVAAANIVAAILNEADTSDDDLLYLFTRRFVRADEELRPALLAEIWGMLNRQEGTKLLAMIDEAETEQRAWDAE